jgi:YVTN family beta-propeller protein
MILPGWRRHDPVNVVDVGAELYAGGERRRIALGAFMLAALALALAAPAARAHDIYVGNEGSGTVSAIDGESDEVVGEPIPAGAGSGALAITPDGSKAYVANHEADSVSVIDTESNEAVGGEIAVGEGPRGVTISPDGTRVYVANEDSGTISVIDTASDAVVGEITPVPGARGIAITPDGRRLYVGQHEASTVSVVDTETDEVIGEPIEVGSNPQGIAFTPDGSKAYVANLASASVSVIDTATEAVIDTVPVGSSPVGVAISPDGKRAYVADYSPDNVSVIDTESDEVVGEPIEVGEGPRGVAFTPDGKRAYVSTGYLTGNPGTVSVIDTESEEVIGEPIVGSNPLGVAVVPDQPPLASLAPAAAVAGWPVLLNASASTDPDGQIARYDWSFGDGQTALDAGPTPAHVYSTPGTYRATVTVTDSEGCSTSPVFTGLTASCNGSSLASATSTVTVAAPLPPVIAPSNLFYIRRLHVDRRHGIAKLRVWVPGPGTLLLRGRPVRTVKRRVGRARTLTLVVRPRHRQAKRLKRRGHLKVRVTIAFRPDGGTALTRVEQLKLVRRRG